jgi:multicomponent Na+:H+ antiporter subunit A
MYLTVDYRVSFDFLIDIVSLSFSFLTITIAIFVYIYTFSYFRYEPLVDRLVLFLNSFIISMAFLVSSGNFIILFLG